MEVNLIKQHYNMFIMCVFVCDQLPGLGSQTSLSLQECLRLLEATFPFGEEAEVRIFNMQVL